MGILRAYGRELVIGAVTAAVLAAYALGLFRFLDTHGLVYFAPLFKYMRALAINLAFITLFTAMPRAREGRHIFLFLQVFLLGYMATEVLYSSFHPKLALLYPDSKYLLALFHTDSLFIHRAYQVVPLSLTALLLLSYGSRYERCLRFGDWNRATRVVGRERTWREIVAFFIAVLFSMLAAITVLAAFVPALSLHVRYLGWGPARWALLAPIMGYSILAALIEEIFFRGIFLSVLRRSFGARGNVYQALLFGAIHFDALIPAISLVKLVIFGFLGWLWGRAASETGGLGCSTLMHFAILFALNLRLYFFS